VNVLIRLDEGREMTSDIDPEKPKPNGDPQGEREIVDLIFNTLREFRQEMAPRLALDGMFVSTQEPLARGTKVQFRFVLPEEFVLAHGDAIVAWRRTRSTHPDLEPGMALWFEGVEERSRDIINELVDIQATSGDNVFDTRRGAGEVGDFVANEFAGSFAPASDIPRHETPPEPPSPVIPPSPEIERPEPEATPASENALPKWLSDAEKRREEESKLQGESSAEETRDFSAPEPVVGGEEKFEVSLMVDDAEPDTTPLSGGPGSTTDLTVTLGETEKRPRSRRLWPLAGLAVVLLAAVAVVVWWMVIRPQMPPIQEVHQSAGAEPTAPAVILLEDPEPDAAAEPLEMTEGEMQPAGEPPTAAEEEAQPPPPVIASAPATRVIDVGAERLGDATVIGIRGNGDFDDTRLQVSMLKDPSRVLVRVARIETFYRPSEIEVDSPEVLQVRIGYHPEDTPAKLYVVIDLADESMVIRETSVVGDTIRVAVGRE
jgi:hypothetical protein